MGAAQPIVGCRGRALGALVKQPMTVHDDNHRMIADYYADQLRQDGDDGQRVGWNGATSQHLRFQQVRTVVRDPNQPFSILDWGCGLGALVGYLDANGYNYRYTGYDINTTSVEEARARHAGNSRVAAITAERDSLTEYDFVVSVGIFNYKGDKPTATWEPYVLSSLATHWAYARLGLAANFLTAYSDTDRMEDTLYYPQPETLFGYAKRALSRNVALLHDYDLYDCTLIVRR
ncbi:MAG: class I SAM-dependent methyltransferase [Chloroflexota bacterium]